MAATTAGTAAASAAQRSPSEESLEARIQTAERFAEALRQDQFSLFAQPIVPLAAAGKANGRHLEIFVRFREEEERLLPPGTFFPILEANHLTPQLDRWEVGKVLGWAAARRKARADWSIPTFNINLADDTIGDADFPSHAFASLCESRIPPDRLWFEITVRQVRAMREAAELAIAALNGLGCAIAVSDFSGAETEARSYRNAGVRYVKLSGAMVRDVHKNHHALSDLLDINDLCHKHGLQTIAQFVETDEALTVIRKAGVDFAQGFRIAMPVALALLS